MLRCADLLYTSDEESLVDDALTLKENRDKENSYEEEAESGRIKLSLLFFPFFQNN